jgi:hypothetical protein
MQIGEGEMARIVMIAAVSVLALVMASRNAAAGFVNGNDLYSWRTDANQRNADGCFGYITGAADALEWARVGTTHPPCIPEGVQSTQVRDVVVNYLRDHPEQRQLGAEMLILVAMELAWNCK